MEYTKPVPPTGPPPPWYKNPVFFVVPLLIVLIISAVCALIFLYPPATAPIRSAISAQQIPPELQEVKFLAEEPTGTAIYNVEGKKFVKTDVGGVLLSAERTPSGMAQVIKTTDGTYRVLLNDKELFATTTALLGVSVSPDQNQIVYSRSETAEIGVFPAGLSYASVRPSEWKVYTFDISTGTHFLTGTGNHSLFVSGSEIARISPRGIVSFNLSTGSSTQLLENEFQSVPVPSLVSPDRTKIALVNTAERVVVVSNVSGTALSEVERIPLEGKIMSFALGDNALYVLRTSKWGTEILKRPFGTAEYTRIMLVPENLKVNRLLISSL